MKGVTFNMNLIIILVSVLFAAYFTFTIIKTKIIKYTLPPMIGLLYGFMLFFVGMSLNSILYLALAALPVIVVVILSVIHLIKAK